MNEDKKESHFHVALPTEMYQELAILSVQKQTCLKDLVIYAINEKYLERKWESTQLSPRRLEWYKK